METPSSSTTTPSPLLGYLRPEPAPSSSRITDGSVDMAEVEERQQAVQKFLAGAEMSKVCASILRRLVDPQTRPLSLNLVILCLCVWLHACQCADPLPVGVFPLLYANINASSFSSCSLLAPCAHASATLHTRPHMTCQGVTYAILKPRPHRKLFRTHAQAYFNQVRPALLVGRDPWAPLRP
jgi:hypothetical protein